MYEWFIMGVCVNVAVVVGMMIFWTVVITRMGENEFDKLGYLIRTHNIISNTNYIVLLNLLIPFYSIYTSYIEITLFKKIFNHTADSIIELVIEVDKYKLFKAISPLSHLIYIFKYLTLLSKLNSYLKLPLTLS